MRLKAIKLNNFRAYLGEVTIPLGDLTAFIGKNDIGKSSILEAAAIFFESPLVKVDPADLCVMAEAQQGFRIGCVFTDLPTDLVLDRSSSTTLDAEYLLNEDGDLEVHKVFTVPNGKVKEKTIATAFHPTAKGVGDLLLLKQDALKARLIELNADSSTVDHRSNVSMRRAVWAATADLKQRRVEIPLDQADAKEIWGQLSKHLPHFALFRADRPSLDSDAEVQDPMQLAVREALAEVAAELGVIKDKVRDRALDVARRTVEKLREMNAGLAEELIPDFRAEPKWDGLFKLSLIGKNQIPLNKRGSGVRRLVLFSFFRAEADRARTATQQSSIIYAVEEPEASQHPEHQRMLVEALRDLSSQAGCQVMITTHIPGLAGLLPVDSLRYISGRSGGSASVEGPDDTVYSRIATELGILPDRRVQVLVFVEGPHDVTCMRTFGTILRQDDPTLVDLVNDPRIVILPVGGSNLKDWVDNRYLGQLQLPEIHIYDRGRENPPKYQALCDRVNAQGNGAVAFLTTKAELENYLHEDAIEAVCGVGVQVTDDCDVPELVARALHEAEPDSKPWDILTSEEISRKHGRVKRRLNGQVAEAMNPAWLASRRATEEIKRWLGSIQQHLH